MNKIIVKNIEETMTFAVKLSSNLKNGDILAVSGNLGVGKTSLAQALAKSFGVKEKVSSPTFNIIKVYQINNNRINKFIHIDAYRLKSSEELLSIGIDDYFKENDSIIFIEWPEKIKDILPERTKTIKMEYLNNNQRIIFY